MPVRIYIDVSMFNPKSIPKHLWLFAFITQHIFTQNQRAANAALSQIT